MQYNTTVILKEGRECLLRNAGEQDGEEILDLFIRTHRQTDYLLSYPDEIGFTAEEEANYLKEKTESEREIEILAQIGGKTVGTAGIESLGNKEKVRHRCDFGISVDKDYWGLGVGRALTRACIECAEKAGYRQIELQVVGDNKSAVNLYQSEGFTEYGRNPKGFRSRITGWQEVVLMRKEINAK